MNTNPIEDELVQIATAGISPVSPNQATWVIRTLAAAGYVIERGWQPIETASKNSLILGCREWSDGRWDYRVLDWRDGPSGYGRCVPGWYDDNDSLWEPTHWRPLPSPPAAGAA